MDHSYDLTAMKGGGFRAECLVVYRDGSMCGWYFDSSKKDVAQQVLRQHMTSAHSRRITMS